jgi:hypothetical protein
VSLEKALIALIISMTMVKLIKNKAVVAIVVFSIMRLGI